MAKAAKNDVLSYNTNLRAEIETDVNEAPRARVHSVEWRKIMDGEPVEINPSIGHGYKIMTVDEWAGRWKRNDDFPECLSCNSNNTKEHHFTQVRAIQHVRCLFCKEKTLRSKFLSSVHLCAKEQS